MKMDLIVKWILVSYTSVSSGRASGISISDTFRAGKIIDTVICKADPTQSYALYIPQKGNREALPVIYFFDPHGDGALPLNKYKSLSEAYGFILIGSNNSKNGNDFAATERIWRHLSDDTRGRLKINSSRIYTCGFSGGAKVAGYVALQHPGIRGVIANGAGLPDGTRAGDFTFSFTAIAGEGDMNLTELVGITGELDKSRTRHRIILFDGKHEWAPVASMGMAFAGLQFDAMKEGLIPGDESFINRYMAKSRQRIEVCSAANQLLKARQESQLSLNFLEGLTDQVRWFKDKAASLANDPQYQKQRQARDNLLVREQNTKAEYMQEFQHGDRNYWNKVIADLKKGAGTGTEERAMYQRLLAYLSLAFYSISNHLINSNENNEARHFVELYQMADPANSEAWYFSALLHARDGQIQAAESDLLKAAALGFRDRKRLEQQQEFKNLFTATNFSRIEGKM